MLGAGPALADYRITRDHGGEIKSYESKYERLRDAGVPALAFVIFLRPS